MVIEDILFSRQFLLTKKNTIPLAHWIKVPIADFNLYHHPLLDVAKDVRESNEIFLLGYAFDSENPTYGNLDIVKELLDKTNSLQELIKMTDNYTGQFIILYKQDEKLYIFNDACAQREVYFTTDFKNFGSQLALLEQIIKLEDHTEKDATEFYNSSTFNKKKIFIGAETNKRDTKHLRPNHYLDINDKKTVRFFPSFPQNQNNLDEVAEIASSQLKKFIKAVSHRYNLALPVTAGYDSRMLFGASLEVDCYYFIFQHKKLQENHPDIFIPKRLLKRYGKELNILIYPQEVDPNLVEVHKKSIDFYRPDDTATIFNGYRQFFKDNIVLNGNISEIAKSFFGNFKNIKAEELAFFNGVESYPYAVKVYDTWLKENNDFFEKNGFNVLDMFYWEEKMGNWAAKGKTEALLGTEFFSPFNSRNFINLLLSVDREYRDTQFNQLFIEILKKLSPKLLEDPINPDRKTKAIKLMKKIGVYDLYRKVGLKYRILKF